MTQCEEKEYINQIRLVIQALICNPIFFIILLGINFMVYKVNNFYGHLLIIFIYILMLLELLYAYLKNCRLHGKRVLIALALAFLTFAGDVFTTMYFSQGRLDLFLQYELNPIKYLISSTYPIVSIINLLIFKLYIHLSCLVAFILLPFVKHKVTSEELYIDFLGFEFICYKGSIRQVLIEPLQLLFKLRKKEPVILNLKMLVYLFSFGSTSVVIFIIFFLLVTVNNFMGGAYNLGYQNLAFMATERYKHILFGTFGILAFFELFLSFPIAKYRIQKLQTARNKILKKT